MIFIAMVVGGAIWITVFYGVLLFVPAGTLHWPRAWVLLVLSVVVSTGTVIGLRGSPELLKERWKGPIRKGQPIADRVVVIILMLAYIGQYVLIPLDVFRFHHLLGEPSTPVAVLGLILYLLGWLVMAEALRENPYASPSVRYQAERHQTLVDTGLYGIVRHPMYLGAIPFVLGAPLWLGSYVATLAGVAFVAIAVWRIPIEEKMLREQLAGYPEYTRRVRHRLLPFVW